MVKTETGRDLIRALEPVSELKSFFVLQMSQGRFWRILGPAATWQGAGETLLSIA